MWLFRSSFFVVQHLKVSSISTFGMACLSSVSRSVLPPSAWQVCLRCSINVARSISSFLQSYRSVYLVRPTCPLSSFSTNLSSFFDQHDKIYPLSTFSTNLSSFFDQHDKICPFLLSAQICLLSWTNMARSVLFVLSARQVCSFCFPPWDGSLLLGRTLKPSCYCLFFCSPW